MNEQAPKPRTEEPSTVHGRLMEAMHIAGYTFERAVAELDWLMTDERWKQAGGGFELFDDFVKTLGLEKFKMSIDQRKGLAEKMAAAGAHNRPIAKALGVDETTVRRDLAPSAANAAPAPRSPIETKASNTPNAANAAPAPAPAFSSFDPAKAMKQQETRELKTEKRAERETQLAAKIAALPEKKYGVILADPEWKFQPYSEETGMDRAADNHYPTSALEEIKARNVPSIAAEDCVLFLWATSPMLAQALEVLEAWGFEYKSGAVWVKDRIGTGYWFRNQHEFLLVGTRGNIPAPAMGDQFASVIMAPVGEHSEKPEAALAIIEAYYPNIPKIELNRRGPPRPGWDAWGNEAEQPKT